LFTFCSFFIAYRDIAFIYLLHYNLFNSRQLEIVKNWMI
jgi:hypothetical protein